MAAAVAPPGAPVGPLTKLELSFECKDLPNYDIMSKTDPQIFIYLADKQSRYTQIGATENMRDTLNPKFAKTTVVDYYFEEVQKLRFTICDIDKPTNRMEDQDYVGEVTCTVGDIMGHRGSLTRPIINAKRNNNGTLTVRAVEVKDLKTNVRMQLTGNHLDKKDLFGKSDPYVTISRINDDGSFTVVHRTEVIRNTLDPVWREIEIPLARLNGGDLTKPILFQCYDWDKVGTHDFIGEARVSIQQIQQRNNNWDLVNPSKARKKKSYKNSGVLNFHTFALVKENSFLDYLAGGTEMNLMVAIDYTASNGDPRYSNSLHYRNPYEPNQYAKAIMAVGEILSAYDSDNLYPVYGFGAKLPPAGQVSHLFPLTGNPAQPQVAGVGGILQAYHTSLDTVTLYGPTNFAPTINAAACKARELYGQAHDIQAYLVLLIITDGEITDMDDTIREIISSTNLPMSIIIVGVGNADFTNMNILDADDGQLRSGGRVASRDIVQFVPFSRYAQNPGRLAAEVLAEVPMQFMQFMKANKILPRPPPSAAELAAMQQRQLTQQLASASVAGWPPGGAPGAVPVPGAAVPAGGVPPQGFPPGQAPAPGQPAYTPPAL